MSFSLELQSSSVEDTLRIGQRIGEALTVGDVVALVGCLGAGKTHLTKGIALGLGVAGDRIVNSPTFVLVNEYAGRVPVFHVDAYRLKGVADLDAIGFQELCASGGVTIVEWADRVAAAICPGALWVDMTVTGEQDRRVVFQTEDNSMQMRLRAAALDRQ